MEPEYLRDPNEVAFEEYMKQIGDEIKRQNKKLMINPAAMQKAYEIVKRLKAIKAEDTDDDYGIEIKMNVESLLSQDAIIHFCFNEFGLTQNDYDNFSQIMKFADIVSIHPGSKEETVAITFTIHRYLVKI